MRNKLLNISRDIFFLLILLLPINLGLHFEIVDSYVWGVLIDYLIPTLYIQDILVVLILLLWILSGGLKRIFSSSSDLFNRSDFRISILFIFSIFLSVLVSIRFIPSLYSFIRMFLYFILYIYILVEIPIEDYFFRILNLFSISIIFLSILSIAQFINKGSVFNNYLIFGEQPYSASTFQITKKFVFGKTLIPAYGLFRHPNIFGGYLSLLLIWVFTFIKRNRYYLLVFILGCVSLFFTFSFVSWAVFIIGILLHYFYLKNPRKIVTKKKASVIIVFLFSLIIMFLPFLKIFNKSDDPSISRRINFANASYRMIKDYPLFGVGWNNSTVLMDEYNYDTADIRFVQPVHNIFLLVLSESGVFSFLLFIAFIYTISKRLINSSYFHLFLISFLQILLLGSFDHYFLTINQTLLLFWILLGFASQ